MLIQVLGIFRTMIRPTVRGQSDAPTRIKTGSAPLATPEDIENGVFADNVETYRKLTGRAA